MAIDPEALLALTATARLSWTARDAALYALGVGLGRDPLARDELRYVALEPLTVLPTMAASLVVGHGIPPKQMGVRFRGLVHAAQRVIVPRPLPDRATVDLRTRVASVYDLGERRGAAITTRGVMTDAGSGVVLAEVESEVLARADGGFGGSASPYVPSPTPDGGPDLEATFAIRPDQAILFRLSGDTNPLHVDPDVARAAGFERPILQGLCSYGMACRAVRQVLGAEDEGIDLSARFSAPVYPGDALVVRVWRNGDGAQFDALVPARDTVVLKGGSARRLAPA